MLQKRRSSIGGGTHGGPLDTNISETAGGIPDDAIGPDQRSVPEQLDLAEGEDVEAMAAKLQAEADERWRTGRKPGPREPISRPRR